MKISNYAYRLDRLRPGNGVSEQQKRGSCADRQDDRQGSLGPRRGYQSDVRCARGAAIIALFWQVSRFEPPLPLLSSARRNDTDGQSVCLRMNACMSNARSRSTREGCLRTAYGLTCTNER